MLKIQDDDSIMCGLYFIAFIEYMMAGKTLLDYSNNYCRMTIKRMTKQYISILRINMSSLQFRLQIIDETEIIF